MVSVFLESLLCDFVFFFLSRISARFSFCPRAGVILASNSFKITPILSVAVTGSASAMPNPFLSNSVAGMALAYLIGACFLYDVERSLSGRIRKVVAFSLLVNFARPA